ncbi:hypothetical protein PENTCL1PPCAC_18171 [Pristionchus entomophagus]|uniref:SAP domain-containing protein n=1 Tax=Pristionchus entomophagus TaxID=358040 RepID=A0AAV5TNT7_9BILA|nr:hypothetical protein PENTCL1PPCAC_18171 [Pristionchus entomophagus]
MSQFGNGPKPPAWGRPPAPIAAPFSTGQFPGVAGGQAFGMTNPMGMMGMPLVNQAAFQQNTMNMGAMGMMAQQAQLNAANAAKMSQFQQGAAVATAAAAQQTQQKNQRTFVGVVTKMHDNYGFVDDDVFFQHSVIRGALPRVGDRVMVEASFNPNMPFKWNAHRVQILGDSSGGGAPAPSGPSPTNMMRAPVQSMPTPSQQPNGGGGGGGQSGGSRWGPQTSNNHNNRAASPRRRSPPPRRSPPRRSSPVRRSPPPRRRSPSPRRSSPPRRSPPRRQQASADPHVSRKRERSPASSTPHERTPAVDKKEKKDSASPPRRRARIIPRYVVNAPKQIFLGSAIQSSALKKRYNHLYVPSDFVDAAIDWASQVPTDSPIDFSTSVQYHVFHKDVDIPESELEHVEVTDADSRFIVKVALLAHADKTELQKKTWGLLPDGSTDDTVEPVSINKNIHLLVGSRGKEVMGMGGAWSPSLDGPDPNALATMIKTAIRTTRTLTGIDLSNVTAWYQLVQVRYYRSDRGRVDRVTLLLPDTTGIVPDDESIKVMETVLKEQLMKKQKDIDEEATRAAIEEEKAKKEAEAAAAAAAVEMVKEEVKEEEKTDIKDESMVSESGDVEMESPVKGERAEGAPTHYSQLEVKAMKVAELKIELEARGLETKGIKTLLAQRLQEALDKEKAKEEKKEEPVSEKKSEETEKEKEKIEEKKDEKTEEQKKKEEEEKKKAAEKAEKERKERKASLEKHFVFPKEPRVLVFPSKTAKSGKFDCKVVSLASLLDYREADNKESQFEMSLFSEALRDVLERTYAFRVYAAVVAAADKDVEKKRREEAKEGKKEGAEGEKKEGEEKEKDDEKKKDDKEKETKKEKIELRSVVVKRDMWEAFAYFDQNLCGYVHERDLDEILSTSDLGIPRGQIQKLAKKLSGSGGKINYRYLTDSLVDPDGETRYVPGQAEGVASVEELARGYGYLFKPSDDEPIEIGEAVLHDDLVSLDGVIINVRQKILAVKRLEAEKDQAAAKMKELETSLKNIREAKEAIEKKKKRSDEDLEKYQKRLRDTEKTLKLAQDEVSLMKSGVSDMKDLARKMIGVADKTLPKKEKKKEETKGEEKKEEKEEKDDKKENGVSEKEKEKTSKTEEEDEPMAIDGGELMLADQVGGDEEGDLVDASPEEEENGEGEGETTTLPSEIIPSTESDSTETAC